MKNVRNVFILLLAAVFVLAACGEDAAQNNADAEENEAQNEAQNDEANEEQAEVDDLFITIATGGTSGVYYPIGGAISNALESEGHDTSVQATGASVENINLLLSDQAEVAITMGDSVLQAYEGFGAFEGEEPKEELVGLAALYPNYVQVVTTTDSGIESFEDLEGKRVGVGDANSGVEINARMMFEAHGMSYDDIDEDFLSYSEAIDQIRNGQVDAAFVTSGLPNSTVIDLSSTHDVTIVPIEGEGMAYLEEHYPFFQEDTIPAGTYDNDEDIPTASIMNLLIANPNLTDDEAYEITRIFFENLDEIQGSHNAAEDIDLDTVDEGMIIPFHPGAERYLEEEGAL